MRNVLYTTMENIVSVVRKILYTKILDPKELNKID